MTGASIHESKRGRPNKRDEIIEKASRIIYERGTSVGVDTLVEEMGVAKMTLYKHFSTKDALIVACLVRIDERYRNWLERNSDGLEGRERILGLFDSLRAWFESGNFRGCAFVNATVELADLDHPARAAVLAHKHRIRQWIADLARSSELSQPDVVAAQIVQLMEGAISTALVENDPSAAGVAREMADILLKAAEHSKGRTLAAQAIRTSNGQSVEPNWL